MDYIVESDIIDKFTTIFGEEDADTVMKLLGDWDFTIKLPDGQMLTSSYNDLMKLSWQNPPQDGEETKVKFTDVNGKEQEAPVTSRKNKYAGAAGLDYYSTSIGNDKAVLTTAIYESGNIYLDAGRTKKYTDESNTRYNAVQDSNTSEEEQTFIKETLVPLFESITNKPLDPNRLFVVNGKVYSYDKGTDTIYKHENDSSCNTYKFQEELKRTGQWTF
jgi:hypothetical protein